MIYNHHKVDVFSANDVDEVFFAFCSRPGDNFRDELLEFMAHYESLMAENGCSEDSEVFVRFHLSDVTTQIPVLRDVNIWLLCASYSLAWVIGYLTMITPGGLGVREAGFFALAAPLMSLPELTFLAVFLRLWQILVETLMFLAFAFVRPSK